MREQSDRFGGKFRRRPDRHHAATDADDQEAKRVGPIEAVRLGVRETYFIIARTLHYLATS